MRRLEIEDRPALVAALEQAARQCRAARLVYRLYSLLLVAEGFSCYRVAGWLGRDPRTVERWVRRYREEGVEALGDGEDRRGRRASLADAQLERLREDLKRSPQAFGYRGEWCGRLLAGHLKLRYGVALGLRQCQRLLRRLRP